MSALLRGLLLLSIVMLASACEDVPVRELGSWQLEIDGQVTNVELPAHLGHGLDARSGAYLLRTTVTLDPAWRGKPITLALPLLRANVRLEVQGHDVPELDEHLLARGRVIAPHRFRIDPRDTADGELTLVLRVESDWAQGSWIDVAPRLASSAWGDRFTRTVRIFNVGGAMVSLVALCTIGLIFYMLHLAARHRGRTFTSEDGKNTDLTRLAFGAALHPLVQLGVLQPLIGARDIGLSLVMLFITVRTSVQVVNGYVGLPRLPRWTWLPILPVLGAMPWLASGFLRTEWNGLLVILLVAVLGYLAFVILPRAKRRIEASLMVGCWAIMAVAAAFDLGTSLGLGSPFGGVQLTCLGLLFFVGVQAYLLSRVHTGLILDQQRLNESLAQQVAEVGTLNEELRRKVGDRSRELGVALRRLRAERGGPLLPGTVLGERYTVVAQIGGGAMGEVYRVERLSDGRAFAAKLVRGRVRPEILERFMREAELAARVVHPNVVQVFDVDVDSDGEMFFIMELVEGSSLEEARPHFGEPAFAHAVLRQLASALAAIHAAGVVHRDLKPSNVLLTYADGPIVKVADFGIAGLRADGPAPLVVASSAAKAGDEEALDATIDAPTNSPDVKMTQTGAIMGTPLYMAPEVLSGAGAVGPSADLYSFALVAYQVLGGPPIERDGFALRRRSLRPFAELAPELAPELLDALAACLSTDPTRRPTGKRVAELFDSGSERAIG